MCGYISMRRYVYICNQSKKKQLSTRGEAWEDSREGNWEGLKGGKGSRKCYNFISLSNTEVHGNTWICMYVFHSSMKHRVYMQSLIHNPLGSSSSRPSGSTSWRKANFFNSDRECTFLLKLRENQECTFPCPKDLQSHREVQFHLKHNLAWPSIS